VKIIDPRTGVTLAPGTTGEICTRGYLVMLGYLGDPEATGAAIDSDGWLHTGDLGSMDERGYCRIAGRIKEMIIRGGENVYPAEIEAVLLSHPAVAEAAVVRGRRPVLGRGGRRGHPGRCRDPAHRGRAQRVLPRPARRLQDPRPLAVHRELPAHRQRQGPQGRAQRAARRHARARRVRRAGRPGPGGGGPAVTTCGGGSPNRLVGGG
jgi:acyl-CoA synthetase (AMP-forming)/AMP-acid ligase II